MESYIGSQYPLHLLGSFRKIIQGLINQSVGKLTTCPDVEIWFDKTRILQTSYVYGLYTWPTRVTAKYGWTAFRTKLLGHGIPAFGLMLESLGTPRMQSELFFFKKSDGGKTGTKCLFAVKTMTMSLSRGCSFDTVGDVTTKTPSWTWFHVFPCFGFFWTYPDFTKNQSSKFELSFLRIHWIFHCLWSYWIENHPLLEIDGLGILVFKLPRSLWNGLI